MTKEELIKENQRLEDRVIGLNNENTRIKKNFENLEYELKEKIEQINELDRDIHFLLGILYKEWVNIRRFCNRTNIEVVEKSEDKYSTITIDWNDNVSWNTQFYHNA